MKKFIKILLVAILVVSLAFFWFWRSLPSDVSFDEHKSLLPHSEFSRLAEINGIKLHYQEKGEGQPLILIHGFASSTYTWKALFDPLSTKFRVIALDLKGFGFSAKPDGNYSRLEQSKLVVGLMDYLKIDKAIICGNSMGGTVAMNIAIHEPNRVKSLILLDSGGVEVSGGGSLVPFYLQIPYVNRGISALALISNKLVRDGLQKSYFDDSKIIEEEVSVYHLPLQGTDGQRAAILARQHASRDDIEPAIPQISVPTLVIWGENDEVIPLEAGQKISSLIKGSELKIYQNCGHLPQEEMPEKLISDIETFAK